MSGQDTRYAPPSEAAVTELVLRNPLAWVVAAGGEPCATLLPIRPVLDAAGRIERIAGHFARSNPQVQVLQREPAALVLFLGPHGYVSPSWMADRTQAPTWNYASVQYRVEIELLTEEGQLDAVMRDLIEAMEAGRPRAWSHEEMGARYRSLTRGVIAFHAHIRERRAKFKLGQDERPDVYADIVGALESAGQHELRAWMRRANAARDPDQAAGSGTGGGACSDR